MSYDGPIWEGIYNSFSEAPVIGSGFDGEEWIRNSLEKIAVLRSEAEKSAPLPPPGNYRETLLPMLASMVYAEKQSLRILDFGGGIGFTYYQTLYALPSIMNVAYHVVERENVCQAGMEFFASTPDKPSFSSELPQPENGLFDIVHMGSSLQYIENWKDLLSRLCSLSCKYLLLVDVFAGNNPTFVSTQNYYDSKIPMWFLNIDDLVRMVGTLGYDLAFKAVYKPTIRGVEQKLPMQNFDERYRLEYACNLLFVSKKRLLDQV